MDIKLTPAQAKLVGRLLKSGRYSSTREVVGAGLRVLARRDKTDGETRAKIAAGLRDVKRGRLIPGPTFFEQFRQFTARFENDQAEGQ